MSISLATIHIPDTYKDEILDNHKSVFCSFGISTDDENWIFWHSTGYINCICHHEQRYVVEFTKWFTKPLSKLYYHLFYQWSNPSYCDTIYSRVGVNQMWILKNYKDLYTQPMLLYICNNIQILDCSIPYTTLPHFKLKTNKKKWFNFVW